MKAEPKQVHVFKEYAHGAPLINCRFDPKGTHVFATAEDRAIIRWTLADGKKAVFKGHDSWVRGLALSPDRKHLVAGGLYKGTNPLGAVSEPLIMRFDWASQKVLKKHITDGVKGVIWRTLFHPDGFLIGASGGSGGGYLLFWETDKDKAFHKFKMPDTARGMDMHPDGVTLATVHYGRKLRLSKLAPKPKPPPKKK